MSHDDLYAPEDDDSDGCAFMFLLAFASASGALIGLAAGMFAGWLLWG